MAQLNEEIMRLMAEAMDGCKHGTHGPQHCEPWEHLQQYLAEAEKRGAERMRTAAVKMADGFVWVCRDPAHDERWCKNCEAMEIGIDQYAEAIGKLPLEAQE